MGRDGFRDEYQAGASGLCVCQYQVGLWEKIVLDKGVLDTSIACVKGLKLSSCLRK
jgi:hypothetical protein